MKKKEIKAGSYVMNIKTGRAYKVTTDTVHSRNRRELVGTGYRNPEFTQIVESRLHPLSLDAAMICGEAERILRSKSRQSMSDKQILIMYRALRDSIVK